MARAWRVRYGQRAPQRWRAATLARPALKLRATHTTITSCTTDTTLPLEQWLVANGGEVLGCTLQYSATGGRALVATRDLEPGERVISVPKQCQIRHDVVPDPRLAALFDRIPTSSSERGEPVRAWQFKQALLLLWHCLRQPAIATQLGVEPVARSSAAAEPVAASAATASTTTTTTSIGEPHAVISDAYLRHLPGLAPGVPPPQVGMLLPDAVVADQLQYPPLMEDVHNHKYWWRHFVDAVLTQLPHEADPYDGRPISYELFGWAVAVVMSRCFGLQRAGCRTLVPLIDFADHVVSGRHNAEIRSDDDGAGSVAMYAVRRVRAGSPLALCYGPFDNHTLLLSYGFVIHDNPHNAFMLRFDPATILDVAPYFVPGGFPELPAGPAAWQLAALQRLRLVGDDADPLVKLGGPGGTVDPRLVAAVRVLLVPPPHGFDSSGGPQEAPPLPPPGFPSLEALATEGGAESKGSSSSSSSSCSSQSGGGGCDGGESALERQLGDLSQPCPFSGAAAHDARVVALLVGLCTAVYQSLPTTIQQDTAILVAEVEQAQQACARRGSHAEAGSTGSSSGAPEAAAATVATAPGGAASQRPVPSVTLTIQSMLAASDGSRSNGGSSVPAAAAVSQSVHPDAVVFRLGQKRALEAALRGLLQRQQQLLAAAAS